MNGRYPGSGTGSASPRSRATRARTMRACRCARADVVAIVVGVVALAVGSPRLIGSSDRRRRSRRRRSTAFCQAAVRHTTPTLPKLTGKIVASRSSWCRRSPSTRRRTSRADARDLPRPRCSAAAAGDKSRGRQTRRSSSAVENVNRRAAEGCELYKRRGRHRRHVDAHRFGVRRAYSDRDARVGSAAAAVGGAAADGVLVEALRQVQALEHELDGRRDAGGRLADVEVG